LKSFRSTHAARPAGAVTDDAPGLECSGREATPLLPPADPTARGESAAVAVFGAAMMALLATYLYPIGGLQERWLAPHVFMPQDHYDERFLVFNAMVLLWLPMLFIFWGLRREPAEFGFRRAPDGAALRWTIAGFLIMAPIVAWAATSPTFQATYPLRRAVRLDLRTLVYFELTYGFYFFCWEWFFRGFLLFGLWRGFGAWAIPMQAVPFGLLHWGKPPLEVAGSFIAGVALALLALRARSFLPCFALHWAVAATMDLASLTATRWHPP
jgi:membrane protease YdiL (CAAX protease family)